jgi:hypothetical protein
MLELSKEWEIRNNGVKPASMKHAMRALTWMKYFWSGITTIFFNHATLDHHGSFRT